MFQVTNPADILDDMFLWAMPYGVSENWDAGIVGNRPLVMQLDPWEELLVRESDLRGYIDFVGRYMDERGLVPTAVAFGEEWYLSRSSRRWQMFEGLDDFGWADALKAKVDAAHVLMKERWPNALSIQIEPWFTTYKGSNGAYYMPPYDVDVLALDAFLFAHGTQHWGTQGMPLLPDSPYQKFHLEVGRLYEHAATYGKPLVMIPQVFKEPQLDGNHGIAPTAAQLRWWFELAQKLPSVVAIGWFGLGSSPWFEGLDSNPELRAEVVRELREMGYSV